MKNKIYFCYGEIPNKQFQNAEKSGIESEVLKPFSNNILNNDNIAIKTNSVDYFSKDIKQSRLNYGNVMHEAFEYIHSENDIDGALNKLMFEGKISENEKSHLTSEITSLISQDNTKQWYDSSNVIKTENTIISSQGTYRPDRVVFINESIHVIDYKFGEKEDKKYEKQMMFYIRQIKQMHKKPVLGFIWYVTLGKIVEIAPQAIQGNLF